MNIIASQTFLLSSRIECTNNNCGLREHRPKRCYIEESWMVIADFYCRIEQQLKLKLWRCGAKPYHAQSVKTQTNWTPWTVKGTFIPVVYRLLIQIVLKGPFCKLSKKSMVVFHWTASMKLQIDQIYNKK